jgi:hypothetical protein
LPVIGFFAAPIWWSVVGWMLKQERRGPVALMMAMHTCAIGLILWLGTPGEPGREQWRYFRATERAMPIWLWSGIVVYLLGFVVAWVLVAKLIVSDTRNKPQPANMPLQPPSGGVARTGFKES